MFLILKGIILTYYLFKVSATRIDTHYEEGSWSISYITSGRVQMKHLEGSSSSAVLPSFAERHVQRQALYSIELNSYQGWL